MTLTKRKPIRRTQADQKRSGSHHHVGHHYLKTYWPYLPIITTLLVGFTANGWISSQHRSVLGYATDLSANALLTDTNSQRTTQNESPLTLNGQLDSAAQSKANDMAARNYWSHDTPDGKTPWSFIVATGYNFQAAGENLAYGFTSAQSVITGWMNSLEHRANMLNSQYQNVGFGIANIPNYQNNGPETLVVALYATPVMPTITTASATMPFSTAQSTPTTRLVDEPQAQHIARIQLINSSTWITILVGVIGAIGLTFLIFRHSRAWHKALGRGERFIVRHPVLDILAALLFTSSALLMHTAGVIH
jgi:uncharacterized protein YkwD